MYMSCYRVFKFLHGVMAECELCCALVHTAARRHVSPCATHIDRAQLVPVLDFSTQQLSGEYACVYTIVATAEARSPCQRPPTAAVVPSASTG